jgi:hypothetical protein
MRNCDENSRRRQLKLVMTNQLLKSMTENDRRKFDNIRDMAAETGVAKSTLSWMTGQSKRKKRHAVWVAAKNLAKLAASSALSEQTRNLAKTLLSESIARK